MSIFHTRLRLNFSALKYHLFPKKLLSCPLCDAPVEDAKHYFPYCPSFAALPEKLFTWNLLGNTWHCASDKKKVDWFLCSISHDDFDTNVMLFSACPIIISLSNCFC